jgi:hypothetical protein
MGFSPLPEQSEGLLIPSGRGLCREIVTWAESPPYRQALRRGASWGKVQRTTRRCTAVAAPPVITTIAAAHASWQRNLDR